MISPSRQPSQFRGDAIRVQLAFLGAVFVRFVGILYPVMTIILFGWQEMHDFIDFVRATAAEGTGRKAHRLTNLEFVLDRIALTVIGLSLSFTRHF
jgi:hypothetical protein